MVEEVVLKNATETAWTVYRARHPHVDASDGRRCLMQRHLHRRWEERQSDAEDLATFGLAYLHRLRRDECLTWMKMIVARVAIGSPRPGWTLLAISFLISAVLVVGLRIAIGA
jgi:hypothetical protein